MEWDLTYIFVDSKARAGRYPCVLNEDFNCEIIINYIHFLRCCIKFMKIISMPLSQRLNKFENPLYCITCLYA